MVAVRVSRGPGGGGPGGDGPGGGGPEGSGPGGGGPGLNGPGVEGEACQEVGAKGVGLSERAKGWRGARIRWAGGRAGGERDVKRTKQRCRIV